MLYFSLKSFTAPQKHWPSMCEIILSKILCPHNKSANWWCISWGRRVLCKGKGLTPSPGRSAWTASGPSWAGAGDRSLQRHPSPRNYTAWTSSPSSFHWEKQVTKDLWSVSFNPAENTSHATYKCTQNFNCSIFKLLITSKKSEVVGKSCVSELHLCNMMLCSAFRSS